MNKQEELDKTVKSAVDDELMVAEQASDEPASDVGVDASAAAAAQPTQPSQAQAEVTSAADWASQVETLQKQLATAKDQALRSTAEVENIRRRSERDLANAHKYALDNFAQELLPVLDSLEMGVSAASESGADVEKLREGSEMTLKMAIGVVEKFGIQQIDPQGEKFNPELHQAMSTQPTDEMEPNMVVTVYQKGYTLNERLIRPALVVVSQKVD